MVKNRIANGESRLPAAERQRLAFELRLAGVTYEQIAQRLGYGGPSGAHKAVSTWLRRTRTEPSDELIRIETARIDRLWRGLWERAAGGDLQAADRALRLMERRSKLLGLDSPTKVDARTENVGLIELLMRPTERRLSSRSGEPVR